MIRAAFFDIDGTLLGLSSHEMAAGTRASLHALRKQGVKLFLSTGRSPSTVEAVKPMLDFVFDGLIAVNGQYCVVENTVVRDAPIPYDVAKQAIDRLTALRIGCTVFERERYYANLMNDDMRRVKELLGKTGSEYRALEAGFASEESIYQISPYFSEAEEEQFLVELPHLRSVRWHPLFADLIPADGGKASGVESVLLHYGLQKEECIAFGDGGNDAEMLAYAGLGVAMAGGSQEAIDSADYVTATAEEDGITQALRHFQILESTQK